MVCFECGRYGHRKEGCLDLMQQLVNGEETCKEEDNETTANEHRQEKPRMEESLVNPEVLENYGPWMLAQERPWRSPKSQEDNLREKLRNGIRRSKFMQRKGNNLR